MAYGVAGALPKWIESTFDTLKDQLGLEQHGGRTLGGVFVRVAQRLLALASGIWWDWQTGAPDSAPWSPTTTEPTIQSEAII